MFFPFLGLLPLFSYVAGCLAAILFYLKTINKTWADLGLTIQTLNRKAITVGIISGVIWVTFIVFIYSPIFSFLIKDYNPNHAKYDFLRKSSSIFFMTILTGGWLVGGFYEEIAFRACIPNILCSWNKNRDSSYVPTIILSSLLYGLYYWRFDIYNMIPATLGGIYWSILVKRFKGNIWYSIISHGTYSTLAYVMIYYGKPF